MSGQIVSATPLINPCSLNSPDNPGALITSVVLKEHNYTKWATKLKKSLQTKHKLGFLDGSVPKPIGDPELAAWSAANSMLIGWIRTSIDPVIRSTVSFVSDTKELWESLQRRFSTGNGVHKQLLRGEISACKQEGQPVLKYYGRLTKLWEEPQNYNTCKLCTCAAAPDIAKECEDDHVHQFLFGLDERFRSIHSTITDQEPLPDLYHVYSHVIREEQNLNASYAKDTVKTDVIGFSVQTAHASTPMAAAVSTPIFQDRSSLLCTHCNRQGHEVTECFLVHGYPEWWLEQNRNTSGSGRGNTGHGRGNNNRGGRPPPSGNLGRGCANTVNHPSPSNTTNDTDQITQLINLLQAHRPNTTSKKLSGKTNISDVIIDTGASHYMTADVSLLTNVADIIPSAVTKPDGSTSRATKRGS